ncbi:MAG: hypothetical protein ACOYM8_19010 [Caulobacterales bacterium]
MTRMTRIQSRSLVLTAALLAAGATSVSAQGWWGYGSPQNSEIDMRQARQAERIERGYRDGSLTPREAAGLMEQQRRIAEIERRAKADGYLDPYERAQLRTMQENASRSIASERRDFEGRNAAFDRPWWRRWY